MSSTPSRFLRWRVKQSDHLNPLGLIVVDEKHRVVCECQHLDYAELIVSLHNKFIREREEWYKC